jgi:phage shock protein PspC (stress-responsive transcriptional regulator)
MARKVLTKSSNRIISGVLGGVADYFDQDATIVRLGYVVLGGLLGLYATKSIASAAVILVIAYAVAMFVMPEGATRRTSSSTARGQKSRSTISKNSNNRTRKSSTKK